MNHWIAISRVLVVGVIAASAACSSDSSGGTDDTSSSGDAGTTSTGGDASTASSNDDDGASTTSAADDTGTSSSDDAASSSDGSSSGGDSGMLYQIDASQVQCFSLASGTATAENPCTTGDLYFLIGFNVDLSDVGQSGWCVKGEAAGLDAVPSDYADCAWTQYVEGADGLANTGYVVRDRDGTHHYRFQIVDNTAPVLQFHYDMID